MGTASEDSRDVPEEKCCFGKKNSRCVEQTEGVSLECPVRTFCNSPGVRPKKQLCSHKADRLRVLKATSDYNLSLMTLMILLLLMSRDCRGVLEIIPPWSLPMCGT
jgi:hypothetical protein